MFARPSIVFVLTLASQTCKKEWFGRRGGYHKIEGNGMGGEQEKGKGCSTTAKVFGIGCLTVVVLAIVVVVVVVMNFKKIAATGVRAVIVEGINNSQLPEEQKTELIQQVDALAEEFKKNNISMEQFAAIAKELAEGPILPLGMFMVVDAKYVKPSGFSDEEKEDAALQIQRFTRGVAEGAIPKETLQSSFRMLAVTDANGNQQLKESLTDDELRTFIGQLKATADKAKILDEPYEVDIAAEFRKAVEQGKKNPIKPPQQ